MYAATIKARPERSERWHNLAAADLTAAKREADRELGGGMFDGDLLVVARHPAPGRYTVVSRRTRYSEWFDVEE